MNDDGAPVRMTTPGVTRRPAMGLAVVGLGASIGPLDFAVAVAFPAITAAFGLETSETRWVAVWYVVAYGSLMLAFGALGDRIGHLRVFRSGLVLGLVSFVLCALAPSYHWFLAIRALNGVAVALVLSCGPALAIAQYHEGQRTFALSRYAAMAAFAGVIAPVIGGQAVAWWGWPGVYWFRVPIAILALACLPLLGPVIDRHRARPSVAFDVHGSLLLSGGVGLLLLLPALLHVDQRGWWSLPVALCGTVLMLRFIRRQRASATPFLPHAVVRDGDFIIANLSCVVVQFASFCVPLLLPYYVKHVVASGPRAIGLLLGVWASGSMVGSSIAARVVTASGARRASLYAALLAVVGLFGIACWPRPPNYPLLVTWLLMQGIGVGLFQVAYTDWVVAALPPTARGVAGSLSMVTRTVGIVLGASAWMGMLQYLESADLAAGLSAEAAFALAFRRVLLVAASIALLFFLVSWRRWRR